jgi:hypothetical protein
VIAADDVLLDLIGRGEPAPEDDKLAGLMATWRADLDADQPGDLDIMAILAELSDDTAPIRPAVPEEEPLKPAPAPARRRWRPGRRYLVGAAAALLLIAGLGVGASQAGPDNPLWPVARVLYPERTDVRLAEHNIALARRAAADGRYADARRTLDKAAGTLGRIDDRDLVGRLLAQIEEIRRTLPPADAQRDTTPATPSPSASSPAPAPAPSSAQPTPTGGQTGGPTEDPGDDETTRKPGGGLIPGLPTPTLPIPLPTITIPGLPLDLNP